jgi:colanic acid biosynthesis glycosyl transferase WcaI
MLASGRPIVASVIPGSGVAREVVGCGIVVPPETPRAIVEAVEALAAHPVYRRTMGEAARKRAEEAWSKQAIIERFEQGLKQLLG